MRFKAGQELSVPQAIIRRPPSAGLWQDQTDEGEFGMSYENLDSCLLAIEKKKTGKSKKDLLEKTKSMIKSSRHKRAKLPIFRKK